MIQFSIYRLTSSSRVNHIDTVEQSVIYCSQALQTSIHDGKVTNPGRYIVIRHVPASLKNNLVAEIQQYDVDVTKAPLKILSSLQDKPPGTS